MTFTTSPSFQKEASPSTCTQWKRAEKPWTWYAYTRWQGILCYQTHVRTSPSSGQSPKWAHAHQPKQLCYHSL